MRKYGSLCNVFQDLLSLSFPMDSGWAKKYPEKKDPYHIGFSHDVNKAQIHQICQSLILKIYMVSFWGERRINLVVIALKFMGKNAQIKMDFKEKNHK